MELWLAVGSGGAEREVAIEAELSHDVGELTDALAAHLGVSADPTFTVHCARMSAWLPREQSLAASGLRSGDRLRLGQPAQQSAPDPARDAVAMLSVVGGPATGQRVPLRAGASVVGRSRQCEVTVGDPTLSREHVRLVVGNDSVQVADAGSANGTFLDGKLIRGTVTVPLGTVIEAGHSLLRFDRVNRPMATARTDAGGSVPFNRPPRVVQPSPAKAHRLPAPPATLEKPRIPMVSSFAPLVLGLPLLIIGLVLGQVLMIVMGAVAMIGSPLIALASRAEDRRSGRGRYNQQLAEHRKQLDDLSRAMAAALTNEIDQRRRLSPDAGDLIDRAMTLRPDLWERRPADPDFLHVALGWADQPSWSTFEIAAGGDAELRQHADAELRRWSVAKNVPVVVELSQIGHLGLCGEAEPVRGVARWIVAQLATLHSPRDLVLLGAVAKAERAEWGWLTWLPHVRGESSPLDRPHLGTGDADAAALFESVTALVRRRHQELGNRLSTARRPTPAVVLMISDQLRVPRAAVTSILEDGPAVAVHVLWLGSRADDLPGECGAVADVESRPPSFDLTLPSTGTRLVDAVLDRVSIAGARDIAMSLSAVKDVTAGGARGQIPRTVNLLDVLGLQHPTVELLSERWRAADFGVSAPLGIASGGVFTIDLRHDGPHALVGGTTGAGKSELLQSFVAALAASHPPNRVTFLLIDYKGGAAFKDAVALPHTVGFVTDLDGHLVSRALVSLNAELRRREHLLRDHGAKDLMEMERRVPAAAPPSLVLIVDEFASLAKELPEFVDGVVNIAQRGRSLGIHLLLATQRPAGAINDNVRANTNLRIALRMNDAMDSEDVIASKEAAALPRTIPGRAFVRTGQTELTEVQVAYVGGHTVTTDRSALRRPVRVFDLEFGEVVRPASEVETSDEAPTDLQELVALIGAASTHLGIPAQHPPWLPPLPAVVPLTSLPPAPAGTATIGLIDLPAEQDQQPWSWDLEEDGSLLVYGTSGSGKTTLLRTLAASLASSHQPDSLHMYVLDFASRGLGALESLNHVGSVVTADEVERVQRLIVMLEREASKRRQLFASAGATLLSEYERSRSDPSVPRVVVLLDGYSGFAVAFEKIDFGDWIERVNRLVAEGRPLGIHWAVTADRRNAVGTALASTVTARVVLRMADDDDYATLGLDNRIARQATLRPGRGFVGATVEMQTALVGDDPAGDAQLQAIERLAAQLRGTHPQAQVPVVGSLPLVTARADLPVGEPLVAPFGVGQADLAPVAVDFADGNLLVAGPNRSGRSTALVALAHGLQRSTPDLRMFLLAPRRTPLLELDGWERAARGAAACDDLVAELVELVEERSPDDAPILVVVDDGNELIDSPADDGLARLIRRGRDLAVVLAGAAETASALRSYSGWIPEIRKDRRALLLNPDPDIDGDLVAARLPRRSGGGLPPGRGYLVLDGRTELVQVAS